MVRAHHLRQRGRSMSQSATILGVSKATVHADLKLLETHWNIVAELTHDDILLDQVERLNARLANLLQLGPADLIEQVGLPRDMRVSLAEMTRLYAVHQQTINTAARELRLLLRELRPETRQRADEIIDIELVEDDADLQLTDPDQAEQPEQGWTRLNEPERSERTIPSKTLEIEPSDPANQNSAEHLNDLTAPLPKNLPRNTGRNKPCPCNSGKKRKHCHPQAKSRPPPDPASPSPGEAVAERLKGVPPLQGSHADALPAEWTEAQRLTQQHIDAEQANDHKGQLDALIKLAGLYNMFPDSQRHTLAS
jgi:hypothetical protein